VFRPVVSFWLPAAALLGLLGLLSSGCDSLSEFKGTFSGGVVEGSFVRSCFAADTQATLTFDANTAVGNPADIPPDQQRNWLTLTEQESGEVVFDARLDPIDPLSSDTLADFDFPGPKRLRNFMLMARPMEGPLAGRDALVVISLLANKHVELRVIARGDPGDPACEDDDEPDGGTADDTYPTQYFGLFKLK
jgi:hypothetical protein